MQGIVKLNRGAHARLTTVEQPLSTPLYGILRRVQKGIMTVVLAVALIAVVIVFAFVMHRLIGSHQEAQAQVDA